MLTEDDAEELGDEGLNGLREVVEDQGEKNELADEEVEEAEEVQGEDVEDALDVILTARLSGGHADEFKEAHDDDSGLEGLADPLRRPDEFLCRACFLLKRTSQFADRSAQLCRDCA